MFKTIIMPFLITLLILVVGEIKLYKEGKLKYGEIINAISLLLIGLVFFIILQQIFVNS